MSQDACKKYLKRHRTKWFIARDIKVDITMGSKHLNLKKLFKSNEVERKFIKRGRYIIACWKYKE